MSLKHRTALIVLLSAIGAPALGQSQVERLTEVIAEAELNGSVAVSEKGSAILSAGYGMANFELGVVNTPETKFRIGSLTKQFTAMAILILQDNGLLKVHDRVGKHVKDVPQLWRNLTIHQLLTHTSGIMHSWALPGFRESMAMRTTLETTLRRFFDKPLVFEPGTGFTYSGVGYFLLAKIIEVVSEQTYADFLRSEIFKPLGMNDSGADDPAVILTHRASGYRRGNDGTIRNAPVIYMPILTGGGNLYSTVADMARWNLALANHALISDRAYDAMYQTERNMYAYGWSVRVIEGHKTISHAGGVPGFNAFNLRIPSEGIDVVVLTNMVPGKAGQVARELARVMLARSD